MIDEKDVKIIEILQKNSRTPFLTIAKKLNVSESTIRKRVKKLENNEIIKKYTITINPKKLGYHSISILGLDISPNHYLESTVKLSKFPEIKSLATTTGDHMVMTEIWTKNGRELIELIKKIQKIPGIKNICPAILLEEIKEK